MLLGLGGDVLTPSTYVFPEEGSCKNPGRVVTEVTHMNFFQQKLEDIKRIIEEIQNTIQKRNLLHKHIMNELEQDSNSITNLLFEISETRKVSKDVLENELYQLQNEKRTEQRLYLQEIWNLRRELLEKETQLHELENKINAINQLGDLQWTQ